jgi:hypothetical protein
MALQPNLTLKVSSKIQRHIRNRRVILGILGNTFTNTGLKTVANFPEAPEIINNSIKPQKKAKYAISGSIKSTKYFYKWPIIHPIFVRHCRFLPFYFYRHMLYQDY